MQPTFMTRLPHPDEPESMTLGQREEFDRKIKETTAAGKNIRLVSASPDFCLRMLLADAKDVILRLFKPDRLLVSLLAKQGTRDLYHDKMEVKERQQTVHYRLAGDTAARFHSEVNVIEMTMEVAVTARIGDPGCPWLDQLVDIALSEERAVHVPDLEESKAHVSGPLHEDLYQAYSARIESWGLTPSLFKAHVFGSVAIFPLVAAVDNRPHDGQGVGVVLLMNRPGRELFPARPGKGIGYYNLTPLAIYCRQFARACQRVLNRRDLAP